MAWGTNDWTTITYSAVDYHFAPNELIFTGTSGIEKNQIVQESESGEIKIQIVDTNTRGLYQFAIARMPKDDRTIGATTVRGFDTLRTLLVTTLNLRENSCTLKPATFTAIQAVTTRYWSSTFPAVRHVYTDRTGLKYYGDGSEVLVFRLEI